MVGQKGISVNLAITALTALATGPAMVPAMNVADLLGTLGVGLLLLAFVLDLLDWLEEDGSVYLVLNLIGAGLACTAAWLIGFVPFVVLEGCWALVSAVALLRRWYRGRLRV